MTEVEDQTHKKDASGALPRLGTGKAVSGKAEPLRTFLAQALVQVEASEAETRALLESAHASLQVAEPALSRTLELQTRGNASKPS